VLEELDESEEPLDVDVEPSLLLAELAVLLDLDESRLSLR
jgi:hypothetical protein